MQSKLKVLEQKLKRKQKVFYMENVGIFGCNEIDEYMHSLTHSILNERKKKNYKKLRFKIYWPTMQGHKKTCN